MASRRRCRRPTRCEHHHLTLTNGTLPAPICLRPGVLGRRSWRSRWHTDRVSSNGVDGQWRKDEQVLAEIGSAVAPQVKRVEIRVPRPLADAAAAAWRRNDQASSGESETEEAHRSRRCAASLALIGLSIAERGRVEDDSVVVELDARFIGDALNAADDHGLIGPP
jgi:hypothetical protein